jgi:hypothetical protein
MSKLDDGANQPIAGCEWSEAKSGPKKHLWPKKMLEIFGVRGNRRHDHKSRRQQSTMEMRNYNTKRS